MSPLYREVQRYRDLPPFTLLVVVGALFGWLLVVWVGLMGRPLGQMTLPTWLALAIGLPLGIVLPLAYGRLAMTTEVFADRLVVVNGMSARVNLRHSDVAAVTVRTDDIRGDYNQRNIGEVNNTRVAYLVSASQGVLLEMRDGSLILIGSNDPAALAAALATARGEPAPVAGAPSPAASPSGS